MKFVIRDDDLNYFSTPTDITKWYGEVFRMNIPVSFSTIPFVKSHCDAWLPRPLGVPDGEYPISANNPLVTYLTAHPLVDILLHGYNHDTVKGIYEYKASSGLYEKTIKGKQELEHTFKRVIRVFVPPHDQISVHGIYAIEKAKLHLIRGKGITWFLPRCSYVVAFFKMVFHRLRFFFLSRLSMPAYPHVLNLKGHTEAFSIRIESNRKDLFRALRYVKKMNGAFILVNHIHDFTEEKKQLMLELITEAQNLEANFVTASDLF